MKKIFSGFTLAEVLITLGIVGVVAALSLPTLTTSVQKQQTGIALAKAINTLQAANGLALQQGQVRRLNELADNPANPAINSYFAEILAPHLRLSLVQDRPTYTNFEGDGNVNIPNNMYQTADGIYYTVQAQIAANGQVRGYSIDVDINGPKGPNSAARDLFRLRVYANGDVVAFGSNEFATREGQPNWNAAITCNRNGVASWVHCAGSIVDNNNRVIYY